MKAVLLQVSHAELERRRKLGADRWDEMWEGVLHMPPAPLYEHQRMHLKLGSFLDPLLERKRRGVLAPGVNVFNDASPTEDYRIPDFSFVAAGRESTIREDGIHGGPDAVIEIRSPGDESYDKLPYFAKLGVREVLVIHRDTKKSEVYRLAAAQYLTVAADKDGWVIAEVLQVRLRLLPGEPPRCAIEDVEDSSARVVL
jgi:Uma2 family endonuclease